LQPGKAKPKLRSFAASAHQSAVPIGAMMATPEVEAFPKADEAMRESIMR
jgi:hypothetical protein